MGCQNGYGGGCCSSCGREVVLTPEELKMLMRFSQIPFLPVARRQDGEDPIYLEENERSVEEYSETLKWLEMKGLISLDYHIRLTNFNYAAYKDYPVQGSMALTAAGQAALDLIALQGMNEI